jgi:hypothetical protein
MRIRRATLGGSASCRACRSRRNRNCTTDPRFPTCPPARRGRPASGPPRSTVPLTLTIRWATTLPHAYNTDRRADRRDPARRAREPRAHRHRDRRYSRRGATPRKAGSDGGGWSRALGRHAGADRPAPSALCGYSARASLRTPTAGIRPRVELAVVPTPALASRGGLFCG